jgi:molybdopterin/thiamine biosynthesis adenylyltransferase
MLAEIGEAGQARLKDKSVLIVGLGGLGSPLALYLAGAGVGTLWLADGDTVDSSNLPRQILFDSEAVNHSKAELARERLAAHNPLVELIAINQRLDAASLPEFVTEVDLVIDCCDNLATRQAINAACVAQGKPWEPIPQLRALVLKPTLLGALANSEALVARARELKLKVIVSSCFESGLGLGQLARLAGEWAPDQAPGLDTRRWLARDLLDKQGHPDPSRMAPLFHRD